MESFLKSNVFFFLFILTASIAANAQVEYIEEKQDDYIPIEKIETSTPYSFSNAFISTIQVNTDNNGNDILNDAANEPSIGVDPNNPDRLVIGWRQFGNIASNFRQAGISYSMDRGAIWNYLDPIEKDFFRSDPVLATDLEGNFYYNSLMQDYSCDVFKSSSLEDWSDKTYAFGGDKQWMVVDKTDTPARGNIYAFWKSSFTDCDNGNFTRSTNQGISYEDCSLLPMNITRGTLDIGPDGELYACGGMSGQHGILKSETAKDPLSAINWDVSSFVNMKGAQALYAGPNPSGMLGQVWIATDHSTSDSRGNVYLLSSVERDDNNDPADIMFSKSVDGGENWSEAIRINTDNSTSNWQWFGTLSVAPNGRIDVVWLDTRDNPGSYLSSLYYSYSIDAGETWSPNMSMSDSFDPHVGFPNQNKIGDYFHMVSTDEGAHLAWAATFNGGQDVYYSFIPAEPDLSATSYLEKEEPQLHVYPNPTSADLFIELELSKHTELNLKLIDVYGNTAYAQNKLMVTPGINRLNIEQEEFKNRRTGLYYLVLTNNKGTIIAKRTVVYK